eukprot:g16783.t1
MDEARGRMILRCGASSRPRRLRSRHLVYAAGPAIGGGVCLALTGAYPELPPHVFHCLELRAPLHVAILRVLVGSTGVALLLLALACPLYVVRNAPLEGRTGAMKVALLLLPLTLAPVWVFFLSQLVMEAMPIVLMFVMNSLKSGVTTPLNQLVSEIATLDVTELRGVEEEEGSESG